MTTICHLFDESAGWEQRIGASQIATRTDGGRRRHIAVAIDPGGVAAARSIDSGFQHLHRLARFTPTVAPQLHRLLRTEKSKVSHAWGIEAALAGRAACDTPLLVHLFNPKMPKAHVKLLRTLVRPQGFAIACTAETVRRRLIEGGVPAQSTVVIRPAVDFGLIRNNQQSDLRLRLGAGGGVRLIAIDEPVGAKDVAREIYWAARILSALGEQVRLAVPGSSRGSRRVARLDDVGPHNRIVIPVPAEIGMESVIAVADALVVVPDGSASMTSIAWAMAAGTTVVASAEYATAELIANKVNGLLFNPKHADGIAISIARLLLDQSENAKIREVARGHAYEVFGLRRFLEQHRQLESNVMQGAPPAEGIVDSAQVS